MAQLNDTMVQGDLRVTGTIYGTQANIPNIYTNDHILYGDSSGNSVILGNRANSGMPAMYVYEQTTLFGTMTPMTQYSKVSSDNYKCMFDGIVSNNSGNPIWHHAEYSGTSTWTSASKTLLTATESISSTNDLEPLLTATRGVVKSSSAGAFPTAASGTSPSGNILGFNCVSWASLGSNQYGIVFYGDTARAGLTYNNSYILGTNASFNGASDIGYDSTAHYFQGMSQSARKAKYAEMALSGGVLDNTINDKMNKDASNAVAPSERGTGATATLLNNLTSTGLDDISSGDVCIPTTNSDGSNTSKWYKRPLSLLWPWIKSKLTGSDVNIGGKAAAATRVTGYLLNHNSDADLYRVSLGYASINTGTLEANVTALVAIDVASGAGGTGSGIAFIVKYNSRGTVRNVSTKLIVDNNYSTTNRPVVLTVTDNTNQKLYFYVANANSSNALQKFNWSKIRVTPLNDVQNFVWSVAGDATTSYTSMYRVDDTANAAKTIYDWHSGTYMKLYVGGLGSDSDTIYIA